MRLIFWQPPDPLNLPDLIFAPVFGYELKIIGCASSRKSSSNSAINTATFPIPTQAVSKTVSRPVILFRASTTGDPSSP